MKCEVFLLVWWLLWNTWHLLFCQTNRSNYKTLLKDIYLDRNKLHYLHPDTFLRLPNILVVNLGYNNGLKIPTDRNFINSYFLPRLDTSYCNESSVPVEIFANVSALERLDLCDNNLRTIDINILTALPKLSTRYLYGNQL